MEDDRRTMTRSNWRKVEGLYLGNHVTCSVEEGSSQDTSETGPEGQDREKNELHDGIVVMKSLCSWISVEGVRLVDLCLGCSGSP